MADPVQFPGYDLPAVRSGEDLDPALTAITILWPDLTDSLASLIQRIGISGPSTTAVIKLPLVNLARMLNSLPASESGADRDPGGLFRRSVLIADRTLALADADWPRLQGLAEAKDRIRFRTLAWYAGLVHDLGRIRHHRVEAHGRSWSRSQYLTDFLAQFPLGQRDYTLVHERRRIRAGINGHEPFASLALASIIPVDVLYHWLSTAQTNNLQAALLGSLGAQGTLPLHGYLRDAGRTASVEVATGAAPPPQPTKPYAFGSGDLVSDFLAGFRALRNDSRLRYNATDGHILLSATHSVLVISEARRTAGLFRIIHEFIGQQIANANIGGAAKAFYAGKQVLGIIAELEARTLKSRQGLCVTASPEQGPESAIHVALISQERISRRAEVLVMPHAALWGDISLEPYGRFTGDIRFYCRDGSALSLDPEEFGFHAPSEPVGSTVIQELASAAVPAGPLVALDSEEHAIVQLWELIARICPAPASAPGLAGEIVRHAEEAIRQGLRRDQVGALIEACADRLRLYTGKPVATAPTAAVAPPGDAPPVEQIPPASPAPRPPAEPAAAPTQAPPPELIVKALAAIGALLATPASDGDDPRLPHLLRDGDDLLLPWPSVLEPLMSKPDIVRVYQQTAVLCAAGGMAGPSRLVITNRVGEVKRLQVLRLRPAEHARLRRAPSPALASLPTIILGRNWSLLADPQQP